MPWSHANLDPGCSHSIAKERLNKLLPSDQWKDPAKLRLTFSPHRHFLSRLMHAYAMSFYSNGLRRMESLEFSIIPCLCPSEPFAFLAPQAFIHDGRLLSLVSDEIQFAKRGLKWGWTPGRGQSQPAFLIFLGARMRAELLLALDARSGRPQNVV